MTRYQFLIDTYETERLKMAKSLELVPTFLDELRNFKMRPPPTMPSRRGALGLAEARGVMDEEATTGFVAHGVISGWPGNGAEVRPSRPPPRDGD